MRKLWTLLAVTLLALAASTPIWAQGQEDSCPDIVDRALALVDDACGELGRNEVCYGHNRVDAVFWESRSDLIFNTPSDRVSLFDLRSLVTRPLDLNRGLWGIAVLNMQAQVPESLPGQAITFLLMGNALLENAVPPPQPAATVPDPGRAFVAATVGSGVYLRACPSNSAAIVGSVAAGDPLLLSSANETGEWYEVALADGSSAWIWSGVALVAGADAATLADLPVTADAHCAPPQTPMQAFYFSTALSDVVCDEAPDALVMHNPARVEILFDINGLSVGFGSTVVLTTTEVTVPGETDAARALVITLLEGQLHAEVNEQTIALEQPEATEADSFPALAVTLNDDGRVDANSQIVAPPAEAITPAVASACRIAALLEIHTLGVQFCRAPVAPYSAPQAAIATSEPPSTAVSSTPTPTTPEPASVTPTQSVVETVVVQPSSASAGPLVPHYEFDASAPVPESPLRRDATSPVHVRAAVVDRDRVPISDADIDLLVSGADRPAGIAVDIATSGGRMETTLDLYSGDTVTLVVSRAGAEIGRLNFSSVELFFLDARNGQIVIVVTEVQRDAAATVTPITSAPLQPPLYGIHLLPQAANVRADPNTRSAILYTLACSEAYVVLDAQTVSDDGATWYHLQGGGWMRSDTLDTFASLDDLGAAIDRAQQMGACATPTATLTPMPPTETPIPPAATPLPGESPPPPPPGASPVPPQPEPPTSAPPPPPPPPPSPNYNIEVVNNAPCELSGHLGPSNFTVAGGGGTTNFTVPAGTHEFYGEGVCGTTGPTNYNIDSDTQITINP